MRRKFGYKCVAFLAAHQHAPHRAIVADAYRQMPALPLGRRAVAQVGAVAFAGVDHKPAVLPPPRQDSGERWHDLAQRRHIVAKQRAEAVRLQKVALHIDDKQGCMRWFADKWVGRCVYR
jgi:hypothetical protein